MALKISVVVPVYNVESLLPRCLNSLLSQSFIDLEIICINDGSTDNSLMILQDYAAKDSRVKVLTQKNMGLSATRNRGVDEACGEYISFIDSDDWIEVDFYKNLYQAAGEFDADIVQCGLRKTGRKKDKVLSCINAEESNFIEKYCKLDNGFAWNKLYRRELLNRYKLRFAEGLFYEDLLFNSQVFYFASKVKMIDYCGYNYYFNPVSITNAPEKEKKRLNDSREVSRRIICFGEEQGILQTEMAVLKNYVATHLAWEDYMVDEEYYQYYLNLLGENAILAAKKKKAQKRERFYLSLRKKKLVICGCYLWGKK